MPTTKEVLEHYGYSPEAQEHAGVGIWNTDEAYDRLAELPDFLQFADKTQKGRIIYEYDPAYPKAMLLTDVPLKSLHPKTNCETAYELSAEDIENAPDQDIGDAILFHMTKTADGAIEICPSKDGQITLRNAEQVSWFISQLLGLSRS